MEKAPNLKAAITAGIGSDHVDLQAAMDNKVDVCEITFCNSVRRCIRSARPFPSPNPPSAAPGPGTPPPAAPSPPSARLPPTPQPLTPPNQATRVLAGEGKLRRGR